VVFASADGVRDIPVLSAPACEDAFAITVHKAQGSEFDAIAFVPAPAGHPLNTRELAYTAITRARTGVRVWGEAGAIAAAAHRRSARDGRLRERILSAARAAPPAG
jgi:exodeoxyribonuclease V alpha subunit